MKQRTSSLLLLAVSALLSAHGRFFSLDRRALTSEQKKNEHVAHNRYLQSPAEACDNSQGVWQEVTPDHPNCAHHLCVQYTDKYFTYIRPGCDLLTKESVCQAAARRGITSIVTCGDSFLRHLFQAVYMTVSDNYHNGSMTASTHNWDQNCTGRNQFENKHCSKSFEWKKPISETVFCDGHLNISYHREDNPYGGLCHVRAHAPAGLPPGQVLFVSGGNHPIRKQNRYGVNNATINGNLLRKSFCSLPHNTEGANKLSTDAGAGAEAGAGADSTVTVESSTDADTKPARGPSRGRVAWISTHYPATYFFSDAKPSLVLQFNEGMRSVVDHQCPDMRYVDVFNMTYHFMQQYPYAMTRKSTGDGVHWGYDLNMIKTQLLLAEMLKWFDVLSDM